MTAKRLAVLRELAWLCDHAPSWASGEGNTWLPFQVRYFRGDRDIHAFATREVVGMSLEAVQRQLRELAKAGLAEAIPKRGMPTQYRITDAGREAAK